MLPTWQWWNRRKKGLIVGLCGGALGASAAYLWWSSTTEAKKKIVRATSLAHINELVRQSAGQLDAQGRRRGSGSPSLEGVPEESEDDLLQEDGLDASMEEHFAYIQQEAVPQELQHLLPQLHELLYELTDIRKHLQFAASAASRFAGSPATGSVAVNGAEAGPGEAGKPQTAAERLRMLARLSFARPIGTCFVIPLMDLLVRVKLNLIGHHLFLQEKLQKLHPSGHSCNGARPGVPGDWRAAAAGALPQSLSPAAVEAFMRCEHLAEAGCRWVVSKVLEGVDAVLSGLGMDQEVGPQDLFGHMARMLAASEAAITASASSPTEGWAEVLVGGDAAEAAHVDVRSAVAAGPDAYTSANSSASMVRELYQELRTVLSSQSFSAALRAGVQHVFRAAAGRIYALIPAADPVHMSPSLQALPAAAQAQALATPALSGPVATTASAGNGAGVLDAAGMGPLPGASGQQQQGSLSNGGGGAVVSVPGASHGHANGTCASRSASGQLPATLSNAPSLPYVWGTAAAGPSPRVSSGGGGSPKPGLYRIHNGHTGASGVWGPVPGSAGMTARTVKPARPLARLLKAVQSSTDSLYANSSQLTQGIGDLPEVKSLSAFVFASTPVILAQ